ncbi:MAG: tetratricopeptide repeat protein [Bacteroidales bacterium]|nr:tetratricopeptide repeat protein [Bacteroidales bacterium]
MLKKQYITIVLFLLFGVQSSFGQSISEIINAFEESYLYEKEGNYTDAIKSMKKVYVENSYEINIRLGWLDYMAGSYTESVTYYNKALTLMPYSEEARFGLVLPKLALGKTNEVITLYKEIVENSPNNTQANYRLGLIYYEDKDYITAFNYFKKVVQLYPFDYDSLLMLAWTQFKLGHSREAKVLFQKVLMYSPNDTSALEGLKWVN